jgi:hypothetical protein
MSMLQTQLRTSSICHARQAQTLGICDAVELERDEFRFALLLIQSPFVPAEAGTQKPSTLTSQSLGPRFRGDERDQ